MTSQASSISVVIPAYAEEQRLPRTLHTILTHFEGRAYSLAEVLVVDDGSRDGTAAVVEAAARSNPVVRLLRNPGNRGKGYSVRRGMLAARGDWVLFTDADLSTPIEELDRLIATADERHADIVIGSRAIDLSLIGIRQPRWRELSGRVFNRCMRTATGLPFRDTQCGFKLYRRAAAQAVFARQRLDGFSFDVEDLLIAQRLRLAAIETPVRWDHADGSKVSMRHGLRAFADLVRIRRHAFNGRYESGAPLIVAGGEVAGASLWWRALLPHAHRPIWSWARGGRRRVNS